MDAKKAYEVVSSAIDRLEEGLPGIPNWSYDLWSLWLGCILKHRGHDHIPHCAAFALSVELGRRGVVVDGLSRMSWESRQAPTIVKRMTRKISNDLS